MLSRNYRSLEIISLIAACICLAVCILLVADAFGADNQRIKWDDGVFVQRSIGSIKITLRGSHGPAPATPSNSRFSLPGIGYSEYDDTNGLSPALEPDFKMQIWSTRVQILNISRFVLLAIFLIPIATYFYFFMPRSVRRGFPIQRAASLETR